MWLITQEQMERRLRRLHGLLKGSFGNVRKDTQRLGEWVDYLHQKTQAQDQKIASQDQKIQELLLSLEAQKIQIQSLPRTREDLRQAIDEYYAHEGVLKRLESIEERLGKLGETHQKVHLTSSIEEKNLQPKGAAPLVLPLAPPHDELLALKQKVEQLVQKKQTMKERLIKRITKNSKDYVKGIILGYIRKYENTPALRLKEMVVDDQSLCSKSSFYRLMEEIEQLEEVGVVREGKEKHYFMKAMPKKQ